MSTSSCDGDRIQHVVEDTGIMKRSSHFGSACVAPPPEPAGQPLPPQQQRRDGAYSTAAESGAFELVRVWASECFVRRSRVA